MADNPFDQFDAAATDSAPPSLGGHPIIMRSGKPDDPKFVPGATGYVMQGGKAVKLEGLPDEVTPDDAGLDPATTRYLAQQVIAGAALPALGMGKAAAKARQQIFAEVARIGSANGGTGADLAVQQAHYKAGAKQVANLENQIGTVRSSEDTAILNGQQYLDRSNELPMQGGGPIINTIVQGLQRHIPIMPGHDTISAMDAAYNTFTNEYAKVVAGSPSGAGTMSDSARHEAMNTIRNNADPSQKAAAFKQMQADMANRLAAMHHSVAQGYADLTKNPDAVAAETEAAAAGLPAQDGQNRPPLLLGGAAGSPPSGGDPSAAPDGPTLAPSGGDTRSVIDPNKQALGAKIAGLMSKGADRNTIMAFAVGADPSLRVDPAFKGWVDQAIAFRAKHPGQAFSVDPSFYTTEAPLSTGEKVMNTVAQSAPGAAIMHAADSVTAGNLGNIVSDKDATARALAVSAQAHPLASLGGDVGGGAMASMTGEGALAGAGMKAGMLRGLVADSLYGGANGATNAQDGNMLGGLAKGLLIGAGGSLVGNKLAKGTGALLNGVAAPSVKAVEQLGVPLTVGQAVGQSGVVGRAVKGVEDRLAGFSGIGDQINARRLEGLQKMNSKAFDRALEPIKETAAGAFGEQAVADAQDKVSNAFKSALGGKTATVDHPFIAEAAAAKAAIDKLPPRVAGELQGSVDAAINNYVDRSTLTVSGENLQPLLKELGDIKGAYYASNDPLKKRIGNAVDQLSASVEDMFRRQAPDVMPQYDAAKKAAQRLYTLKDAVLKAKNTDGVFTTGQLGLADRSNTIRYGGKDKAAAGGGEFHDFQRDAQNVLPNKVPDSGSGGRVALLAVPGAVAASGAGLGYANGDTKGGAETGLTLAGLLSAAYTKAGQRALVGAVLKRPQAMKAAGKAIADRARIGGAVVGTQAALDSSR